MEILILKLFTLVVIIIFLNKLCIKKSFLIDKKGIIKHKFFVRDSNEIPFTLGIIFVLGIFLFFNINFHFIYFFTLIIFLIGISSDLKFLDSPKIRLFLQTLILIIYIFIFDVSISSIRIDLFDNLLKYKFISILFTVFCFLVLINGSNFIDGVNVSLIFYYLGILISIYFVSYNNSLNIDFEFIKISILILLLLLSFNFFGKSFMGDGGAYSLSFFVGSILILFANENKIVSPYYVALLLWYPAYENLFSILRKIFKRQKPTNPDNDHFHHLVYLGLKKIIIIKNINHNTLTGLIIGMYNSVIFYFSLVYFNHTKTLVLIIFFNIFLFTALYLILRRNMFYKNKS